MRLITKEEKQRLCQLFASLFSPPDAEITEQIYRGNVHSFLLPYVQSWGGEPGILEGFLTEGDPGVLLRNLTREHNRLFSEVNGEGISLVESTYKPWTQDPFCSLPFASERGLLMGDPAIHLLEVYRQAGLDVPEEFRASPDHVVLELEFLSCLYGWATDGEVRRFTEDHLDWIPLLREELTEAHPYPLYRSLTEGLVLFLKGERKRWESISNG